MSGVDVPFPPGEKPDPNEVADWAELRVLSTGATLKQGDLRTAILNENVGKPEQLADDCWYILTQRHSVIGARWPLVLADARISRRNRSRISLSLYRFLGILSLGENVAPDDRALFEDVVAALLAPLAGRQGIRIGHPARTGQLSSFRKRVERYGELSHLSKNEIGHEPLPDDKDLGLDAVSWRSFADRRGGDVHFVAQCATGANWQNKLKDFDFDVWSEHLVWAVRPVRVFALPQVVLLPQPRWIRTTRKAGLILDRPRLLELSTHTRLPKGLSRAMKTRLRDRDRTWSSY